MKSSFFSRFSIQQGLLGTFPSLTDAILINFHRVAMSLRDFNVDGAQWVKEKFFHADCKINL